MALWRSAHAVRSALLTLAAFGILFPTTTSISAAAPTAGEIRGTVVDSKTQKPLANVTVAAISPSSRYRTLTNEAGFYDILGVAADTYTISFELRGYDSFSVAGANIFDGQIRTQNARLNPTTRVIGNVRTRSRGSAFNPDHTVDIYSITETQINQVLGKAFNQDETTLLKSVPSITQDKSGTISIRGGFAFEAAYEYEGIDYTVPNANLQNTLQNVGNFNLINGLSSVEVIPGGGDATHGNTGTGLIAFTAKRGTYPTQFGVDFESNLFPYGHQFGISFGAGDRNRVISNYFSFIGQRHDYQYGGLGVPAASLGTRGSNASTLGSTVDPNLVFYSPSYLASNDFVDNLVFRFGPKKLQSIQFFYQGQSIKQDLDYGGTSNLQYFTGGNTNGYCPALGARAQPSNNTLPQTILCQSYLPLFAGQPDAGAYTTQTDQLYSPFQAYKFEYQNAIAPEVFLAARFFRTFSTQSQLLPSAAISAPQFGGSRSAFASELTDFINPHHTVEIGLRTGYSTPFGTIQDGSRYGALTYGQNITTDPSAPGVNYNPPTFIAGAPALDFLTPQLCQLFAASLAGTASATPPATCGYLGGYFPRGVPRFPIEIDKPVASVQDYALFAQDTISLLPTSRLKTIVGLRLDGYNIKEPIDPSSPPGLVGLAHQRQYEPHIGISWQVRDRDFVRANFGHTLTIPLPSLLGTSVDRATYAAYNNIPSFNNATGLPAQYCGISGRQLCASYADQLYWLYRNYRYGAQPVTLALKGATFTNIDLSYEHLFNGGVAIKVTPFFRRGFDLAETAASVTGYSALTGAPVYGNQITTTAGQQKATGIEFLATREVDFGLSATLGATFINQFGNDPPGSFLTPASLAAGTLYHSPNLSPLQVSLAANYKTRFGLRINPVLSFNVGYPYGIGYYTTALCGPNGTPQIIPNTGAAPGGTQSGAPNFVNPVDPGTCQSPNIIATRGNQESASAGGLRSPAQTNANLTIEYSPSALPSSAFGVQFTNLFDQLYGVPVTNQCYGIPVSTGYIYRNGVIPCNLATPVSSGPAPNAFPASPYNVYPNLQPFLARVYYQLKM